MDTWRVPHRHIQPKQSKPGGRQRRRLIAPPQGAHRRGQPSDAEGAHGRRSQEEDASHEEHWAMSPASSPSQSPSPVLMMPNNKKSKPVPRRDEGFDVDDGRSGRRLSSEEVHQLFSIVFEGKEAHQLIFFVDPQFIPDSIGFTLEKNRGIWQPHKA
ncbi:hypothetical protein NL676_009516 [Syzygium grande]|nr:hypothetical protein NL676_009516 [Syzygium grande]